MHRPRPRRRLATVLRLASVLALMASLAGCAALTQQVQEPEVRLDRVELTRFGLTRQEFELTLAVFNPNPFALPLRALHYDIELAGIPFADGTTTDGLEIGADTTSEIRIGVDTNLMAVVPALFDVFRRGERQVAYSLTGEVEYGRFLRGSRPFERTGEVRLVEQ